MKKSFFQNDKKLLISYLTSLIVTCGTIIYLATPSKPPPKIGDPVFKVETEFGYGSGVIIGKEPQREEFLYYVLTAFHLIGSHIPEGGTISPLGYSFILTSYDDKGKVIEINDGTLFASNEKLDLMVLIFLSPKNLNVSTISINYELMDEVYSCTYQLSEQLAITKGIISKFKEEFIVSDAQISPGSSGGGLFIKCKDKFYLIGIADRCPMRFGVPVFHCSHYVSSKSFIRFLKDNEIPCIIQQ